MIQRIAQDNSLRLTVKKPPRGHRITVDVVKKDAILFAKWFQGVGIRSIEEGQADYNKSETAYHTLKKELGRKPKPYISKNDEKRLKQISRGRKRFLLGLMNEAYESEGCQAGDYSSAEDFINCILHRTKIILAISKQYPLMYKKLFHQPQPRGIYEEYLNMVCRNKGRQIIEACAPTLTEIKKAAEVSKAETITREDIDALLNLSNYPDSISLHIP
jgi:hypothetical protein